VVKILKALLADEYALYTKTRHDHWNVVGPQSSDLHKVVFAEPRRSTILSTMSPSARALGGD
jgi:starvation-inducible DNA-binding protein